MPELRPANVRILGARNEQADWDFTQYGARQDEATLGIGGADYTIEGFRNVVRVERKEVNDFVNSITNERERFERQMQHMRQFPFRAVVVEWPSFTGLLDALGRNGHERDQRIRSRKAHWNGVRGSTLHLSRRYCPIIFAGDRQDAQDYAWDFLFGVVKDWWETYQSVIVPGEAQEATR